MPNDSSTYKTSSVGVWFYGVKDYKSSYVWSVLARFVFCQNFRMHKKLPCNDQGDSFLVVFFNYKKTEFYRMSINHNEGDANWVLYEQHQNIKREPNLYFKPFVMKEFS